MKFLPLHDRIVVKRLDAEEVSEGGIFFAPTAMEKPNRGTVIAVGPGKYVGRKFVETVVKENDVVLFSRNAGHIVTLEKVEYTMLTEDEIYGIVK